VLPEYFEMSRSDGWATRLPEPLPTLDGALIEARAYILALPEPLQRRTQWQHAAQLVMTAVGSPNEQTVAAAARQMELALFLDSRLNVVRGTPKKPPVPSVRRSPARQPARARGTRR
jgi:hypothetical protein